MTVKNAFRREVKENRVEIEVFTKPGWRERHIILEEDS